MTTHCKYILLLCASAMMLSVASWAQAPVYTCDFEDAAERAKWNLNAAINATTAAQFENKWYIGAPGHFAPTGNNGLFISADGGQTSDYVSNNTMFVTAAREMPDMPAGDYNLYFDWQCNGKKSSGEGLYVAWIPDSVAVNGAPKAGSLPNRLKLDGYLRPSAEGDTVFGGTSIWKIGKVNITHDGTPHKLVFYWFCSKGNAINPAACIDNIELRPVNQCEAPNNITHTITGDTVILKWGGKASYYDVKCYDFNSNKWVVQNHIQGNTCMLQNVSEGVQTFIIRAFCDDNTASDYAQYSQLIYHKGIRCIDYMELTNRNCYTGSYIEEGAGFPNRPNKVDNGYADMASRHTLHYMPNEFDANTNYELPTIPPGGGYLASVRLGDGKNPGNNSEGISYSYKVQAGTAGVLKIKYAIVLEDPKHNIKDQPHFWLDVLQQGGRRIPNDCGLAKFSAGDGSGWREGIKGWVYRPWDEHAINLRDYEGQTLTIRLVTTDCGLEGHTGYVYFVLDCESGEMSGLNCGEDNPTTHFSAPGGFDYVWYRQDNPTDTLSTKQTFDIQPLDTNVYNVNLINKKNANCWYTLTVSGLPRIPTPRITYAAQTTRCQNIVTFTNKSCVYRRNQVTQHIEPTTEPVTGLKWDFGDGTVFENDLRETIKHVYPDTGGTFTLRVTATVEDGTCPVEKTYTLTLPDLSSPVTEVNKHICRADAPFGFSYGEPASTFYNNIDSTFIYISKRTECDSLCHLVLTFHEKGPFPYEDTICYGDTVHFHGQQLVKSGKYTANLKNAFGCDSIAEVNLFVDPQIVANIPDTINICPDETSVIKIPFDLTSGRIDELELLFDEKGHLAGFQPQYTFMPDTNMLTLSVPAEIRPDVYPATLAYTTPLCEAPSKPVYVQICYSASIIQQRPRVLMLMNADYNGGYHFSSYQWYRDGKPVEKGNGANLAVSTDDIEHEFYVELVREGETTPVRTCSVWYVRKPSALDEVHVSELDGPLQVFDAIGLYLGIINDKSELNQLPSGLYIVTNGDKVAKIIR